MIYDSFNRKLTEYLPEKAENILDLGCGTGLLGEFLKNKYNAKVTGITYSEEEAEQSRSKMDEVICADLNTFNFDGMGSFDLIVCSHVLEHLVQSKTLMNRLRSMVVPGGVLLVALPNVLYWKQRWEFVRGRFQYTSCGLMDTTHVRFFDWITAQELLTENGWKIEKAVADGNLPLPIVRKFLPSGLVHWLDEKALQCAPGLFAGQFIFKATK